MVSLRNALPSDAAGRAERLRHELMCDLVAGTGEFPIYLAALRRRWKITPKTQLPGDLGQPFEQYGIEAPCFAPDRWPERIGPDPFFDGSLRDRSSDPHIGWEVTKYPPAIIALQWLTNIWKLHETLVSPTLHRYRNYSFLDWTPFFSSCVLYDPPRDQLLEFADWTPFFMSIPINADIPESGVTAWSGPIMQHPALVALRDPRQVEHAIRQTWEELFRMIAYEVEALHGISIWSIRDRVEDEQPELIANFHTRIQAIPKDYFIALDDETTDDDVRQSFKLWHAGRSNNAKPRKRSRDPLVSIQVAILADEFHQSSAEIGRRFGFKIEKPAGMSYRSRAAQEYAKEGRILLGAKNRAQ